MRMWMLPMDIMCLGHKMGEHYEIHKHLPSLLSGVKVDGRYRTFPQIQMWSIVERHDILARNFNIHKSPIEDPQNTLKQLEKLYPQYFWINVDLRYNFWDLWLRCPECRRLMGRNANISKSIIEGE